MHPSSLFPPQKPTDIKWTLGSAACMETEHVWMLFGDISWRIRTVPKQSSPTENTLQQLLPIYTEAVPAQLPALSSAVAAPYEPRRSLGQQGLRVGEKKAIREKKNKTTQWVGLEDLQGKIWTGFIHLK